jgi:hypothetical protein
MSGQTLPFKVADLSLAEFGRKEIRLAEHEMPGLMAMRAEYADAQPLRDPMGSSAASSAMFMRLAGGPRDPAGAFVIPGVDPYR